MRTQMNEIYKAISDNSEMVTSPRQKKALQQAITSLPDDQQKVLFLYYTRQMPVKEISAKLQCSVTTTYTKLNTALFTLKNKFNPAAFEKAYRILYPETGKPVSY